MNWTKLFSIDKRSSTNVDRIVKLHLSLGFGLCGHIGIAQGVVNNGASIQLTSGSTIYVDGGSAIGNFKNQDNGAFTGTVKNSGTVRVSGDWINNSAAFVFPANSGTVNLIGANQTIKGTTTTYFNNLTLLGSGVKTLEINTLTGGGFASPAGMLALNGLPLALNTHTLLVNNPNASAITRTTGFIISETNMGTNPSLIEWNAGSTNGTYVFPFGLLAAPNYIPLTISKSSGNTSMRVSTRMTIANDNAPWESTVTDMYSTAVGGSGEVVAVIDRWYDISSATAFTGAVDFTYRGIENTTVTPTGTFGAQNWNGSWQASVGSGPGVTSGTASVSIPDQTLGGTAATPWVLTTTITPLPVELVSFYGECISSSARLYWETASEINNDFFTLERSENGTFFYVVGTVEGAGNSSSLLAYEYRDPTPVAQVSYYRLKQTDFNGANKTSALISVAQCFDADTELLVYPNPASDAVFISLPDYHANRNFVMRLYDATGRLVFQDEMRAANESITISTLQQGVYHLDITSETQAFSERIVITH
jgi:hypothetical protein